MVPASGDAISSIFIGSDRLELDDTGLDLHVVRSWVQNCLDSHEKCSRHGTDSQAASTTIRQTQLPTRVIQIGRDATGSLEARVKLSSKNECGDYLALSYRWGGPQHTILTSSTLASFSAKGGLKFSTLPLGLQHALELTSRLGHEYIWIDALCILQDSADDKGHEISKMQDYYSDAVLTIQPSGMQSVADGFLGHLRNASKNSSYFLGNVGLQCPQIFNIPISEEQSLVLTIDPKLYDPVEESINTRAWVLQERMLCPRVLILPSVGGAIFQCETTEVFQGKIHYEELQFVAQVGRDRLPLASHDTTHTPRELFLSWCFIIDDYAMRDLTDPQDKLVAIAGLAARYSTRFGTQLGLYFCGHWEHFLIESLLWDVHRRDVPPRPKIPRAPSWSWASVDKTRCLHLSKAQEFVAQLVELHISSPLLTQKTVSLPITILAPLKSLFWYLVPGEDHTLALYTEATHVSLNAKLNFDVKADCIDDRPTGFEEVWCALIRKDPTCRGLVLKRSTTRSFRRVGYFAVYSGEIPDVFDEVEKQVTMIE